jgi:hypothetical protein
VDHGVAPDALVDLLALEDLALGLGQQLDELVLAPGQLDRGAGDEGLELVAADLDLADHDGAGLDAHVGALAAPDDGLDASDQLFGMTGLGDPVVGAEPQPADALGDRGLAGADDHAEPGETSAELVEVRPALRAEHRKVHHDRVQPQGDHRIQRHRGGEHSMLPPHALQPLAQDLQEAAVGIDHREADRCRLPGGAGAPLFNHRRHLAPETSPRMGSNRAAKPPGNHLFTSRQPDFRSKLVKRERRPRTPGTRP